MTALRDYLLARQIGKGAAGNIGITADRLDSLYSNAEPTVEEVRLIARFLKVSARELIVPIRTGSERRTKLRSNFNYIRDSLGYHEACRIENTLDEVSDSLGFPSDLPYFVDYPKTSQSAEHLSRIFRAEFLHVDMVKPIPQLPALLFDKFGTVAFRVKARKVDGASYRKGGTALIAIAERNDIRMLFTLAHEVSHLLVDIEDDTNNEIWIDEDVLYPSNNEVREVEFFANEFAATLLIPVEGLLEELKYLRRSLVGPAQLTAFHIASVARKFGTSFSVAARRCENLGLLDFGGAATIEAEIKRKYGSAEKYANVLKIAPRFTINWDYPSRNALQKIYPLVEEGEVSLTRMHDLLSLKMM
ncbi:ImmA/IrrE family metallo-endopeptidase [Rhizobium sp. SAFR-030]|uniref:ImmA/IrrE family metallo-endopeptidase n=1 Tax=Rhizobium sp. SAFR-030 TaxID=3387277 RepID=UPI003F7E3B98